jgi:hypothetical protein
MLQSHSVDNEIIDGIIADMKALHPQSYRPTQPLLPYVETALTQHRQRNLRKPLFSRYGGLRILRLGRLTLQWSWRSR